METVFGLAKWCSTLWIKRDVPSCSASVQTAVTMHAKSMLPNECVGFIVKRSSELWVLPLPAKASIRHVQVSPQVIIDTAYALAEAGFQIVAAYHSHPGGQDRLSPLDDGFALWSHTHILLVYDKTDFRLIEYAFT